MFELFAPEDKLYIYVHKSHIDANNRPRELAFRNTPFQTGTDLSSDWSKYSSPTETRTRIAKQKKHNGEYKNLHDYFIVSLLVENFSDDIPNQILLYDPIFNDPEIDGCPIM